MDMLLFLFLNVFILQPMLEVKIEGNLNQDEFVKVILVDKKGKKNNNYSVKSCFACVKKSNENNERCYVVTSNILNAQEFRDMMMLKDLKNGECYKIIFKNILCGSSKSDDGRVFRLDNFEIVIGGNVQIR